MPHMLHSRKRNVPRIFPSRRREWESEREREAKERGRERESWSTFQSGRVIAQQFFFFSFFPRATNAWRKVEERGRKDQWWLGSVCGGYFQMEREKPWKLHPRVKRYLRFLIEKKWSNSDHPRHAHYFCASDNNLNAQKTILSKCLHRNTETNSTLMSLSRTGSPCSPHFSRPCMRETCWRADDGARCRSKLETIREVEEKVPSTPKQEKMYPRGSERNKTTPRAENEHKKKFNVNVTEEKV